jgi:glycosyltransferase involved in cell wall biosynthesis
MTAKPLVSISCNTYNHEKYIAEAIEGFLAQQTDFPIEILVHDDASTDGTAEVVRGYQSRYPELIKPIFQTENQRSKGVRIGYFNIERAQGEYIALCEGDDFWTDPFKLQKQVDLLRKDTGFVLCFTNFNKINAGGEILEQGVLTEGMKRDLTQSDILARFTPKYLTIVFRRAAVDLSLLRSRFLENGDTFLFALLARHGDVKYLDCISGCYRVHSGGAWSTKSRLEQLRARITSFKEMRGVLDKPAERRAISISIGKILFELFRLGTQDFSLRILGIFLISLSGNLHAFPHFFRLWLRDVKSSYWKSS